ncbi:MAG: 3-deoxy-D-manno-octulosonic acid transferase [Acidobacteria bacterium]|nr:3-deoxy-D-manno-octulosonic acid transferase [Acidobacteriota bacterium]MCA1611770.1 3-deoxy-D-manno-octulosonic acid transferase [Acidobacteriota bacterium]MCA1617425.1 3-deoxy-D-manno-octulosonic acid transferase [Acidobacteriota bacterium]
MLIYRVLSVLALALYAPYALLRSALGIRKLGSLRGRLGREPVPALEGGIWVHAVSVGEVGVARNLLAELARKAPDRVLGLSVTTAAGAEMARRVLPADVACFAFPLDLAGPVERALEATRPGLILLTETEIWPLFLERAARRGIPVALVNGRLSERSFSRYRLARRSFSRVLSRVALFAMQTREDAARIERLGAPGGRVFVTGNVKYDLPPAAPFADAARLVRSAGGRPVVVAASTGQGEDEIVLAAWAAVPAADRPLLVLAPRRPERFDAVAALVREAGHALLRRSSADDAASPAPARRDPEDEPPVYLLDSIGELSAVYGEARLAFVGGSLVPIGGHNPIEAWGAGVPVIVGPHTSNFRDIVRDGLAIGILEVVRDGPGLSRAVAAALADPAGLARRGEAARRAAAEGRGAVARTADLVLPLLPPAVGRAVSR